MKVKHVLSPVQENFLLNSLVKAESGTSGQIRVHLEARCEGEALDRAAVLFSKFRMAQAPRRNGVLIYVAVHDRKAAVLGDEGIHTQVGDEFWTEVIQDMVGNFRESELCSGLAVAIEMVGLKLKQFFPRYEVQVNDIGDAEFRS